MTVCCAVVFEVERCAFWVEGAFDKSESCCVVVVLVVGGVADAVIVICAVAATSAAVGCGGNIATDAWCMPNSAASAAKIPVAIARNI